MVDEFTKGYQMLRGSAYKFIKRHLQAQTCKGATMVEAVILMPIFLFIIFFCIWYGVRWNAHNSVNRAVIAGVKLGTTRASANSIPLLDGFLIQPYQTNNIEVGNFLATQGKAADALAFYPAMISSEFSLAPLDFRTLLIVNPADPAPAAQWKARMYSMVYAYQSLRQGIGNIKYPCAEEGCARCYPINGAVPLYANRAASDIGIRCEYAFQNLFVSPMVAMVNILTNGNASYFMRVRDFHFREFPGL